MIELRSHSAQAYIDAITRMGGVLDDHTQWRRMKLPGHLGTGVWEHYPLQKGLELTISRYHFDRAVRVEYSPDQPLFCFGCLLKGGFELQGQDVRSSTSLRQGQGMNMWASEGHYSFLLGPKHYVGVELIVDGELLVEKLGRAGLLPSDLERIVTRSSFPDHVNTNLLSPLAYQASCSILSASAEDPFCTLLFESCALTILREQLLSMGHRTELSRPLSRREADCVHAVREILLRHPERSPSLGELASQVGTNEFSLTRGFRLQFGLSIYGFLRKHRMEIADQLLAEGQYSVTEVANAVGYRSLGRFAAAFQRQFGVTPKRHQLALRYRKSGQLDMHLEN